MPEKKEDFGKGPKAGGENLGWIQAIGRLSDCSLGAGDVEDYEVTVKNLLPYDLSDLAPDNIAFKIEVSLGGGGTVSISPDERDIRYLERGEEETQRFTVDAGAGPTTPFWIYTKIIRSGWPTFYCSALKCGT